MNNSTIFYFAAGRCCQPQPPNRYPETEKLMAISKTLNISIDYLLNDAAVMEEKRSTEEKVVVHAPSGKIAITTYDKRNVIVCHYVKSSPIFCPGKNEPKYLLSGIGRVSFWGEHSVILGWYTTLEDIEKEIQEITESLQRGESAYALKYYAEIEVSFWGTPKIKKD